MDLVQIGIRRILREHAETGCIVIPAGNSDRAGALTITLPSATAARLDLAVSRTGLPPAEVISTTLELLLSGNPPPPGPTAAADTPTCPAAWRHVLGWESAGPPPTVNDLLPPDLQQRLLDIWLATGTNVAYTQAIHLVNQFEEGEHAVMKLVTEAMEADLYARLEVLRAKWKGGQEA